MNPEPSSCDLGGDIFRCAPMVRLPLGNSAELVYFPLQNVAHVLSPSGARLLGACSRFASLAEHAEQILRELPAGSAGVAELLRTFAEEGLMVSRAELSRHLNALPRADVPPPISCLAIPTSNRPKQLQRAVSSYAKHFSRTGRFLRCLVADDAPALQACRLSREAVEAEAKSWGAAVVYSGPEEKRRLIDLLAHNGSLPRDVLEFGLLGPSGYTPTIGANRNVILLQTAGDVVLSVDDDTLCRPCSPPECDADTLRLGSETDPTEFWFFPDRESSLAFVWPSDVDILAAHEKLLGRQARTLVEPPLANGKVHLDTACAHLIQDIWTGTGRVLITLNGSVGDSGMYSGRNLLIHKEPRTRQRLVGSEDHYQLALRSREVVRQARSATVCHGGPIMTMFVGIDNRVLLPPFFPVGRNEDGVFGYMIGRLLEGCYFGYLPWSLVHDPPQGRRYSGGVAATVRISDLVIACVSTWVRANRGTDTEHRLRSLGRHLIEVASMPPNDFEESIRMLLWRQASQRIAYEEALLHQYGEQPAFWAADLRREIEANQLAVVKPDYVVPVDLSERRTAEKPLREAQDLIRRYGELVRWWPSIVERATELALAPSAGAHA